MGGWAVPYGTRFRAGWIAFEATAVGLEDVPPEGLKMQLQIPPLRFAPVGMTLLSGWKGVADSGISTAVEHETCSTGNMKMQKQVLPLPLGAAQGQRQDDITLRWSGAFVANR